MGHPDGAHTHGSGGGAATAVLVVLVAVLAAAVARPVIHAAIEVLDVLVIVVAVLAGLAAVGLVALAAIRVHRWQARGTTRVSFPARLTQRSAESLPEPPPALERPAVHLHLHGVSAEDIADAIRQAQREAGD